MGTRDLHILLIEDSLSLAELYRRFFTRAGYRISAAPGSQAALNMLAANPDIGLILLDLDFEPKNALQTLTNLRKNYAHCPVIVVTGAASVSRAVEAMKAGASDFLIKPFQTDKLSKAIDDALQETGCAHLHREHKAVAYIPASSRRSRQDPYFGGFVGASQVMRDMYDKIEAAAKSDAGVFITGASGTGKEICAEAIHKYSKRAHKPFVALNCAAIPESLIESELFGHVKGAYTGATDTRKGAAQRADGGTLFLDEICEMHPDTQAKLLRFLQDHQFVKVGGDRIEKVDIRVICATNQDPLRAVETGMFREDLYYRLHIVPIHMPFLKDRETDVLDLAEFFLRRYAREEKKDFIRLEPDVENVFMSHDWPGNVRQLENLIRQIVVLNNGSYVTLNMLPEYMLRPSLDAFAVRPQPRSKWDDMADSALGADALTLEEVEKQTILRAIDEADGNIPKAAERLGVSPSTLYRKKEKWDSAAGAA